MQEEPLGSRNTLSYTLRYAIAGALFGLMFPVGASFIEIIVRELPVAFSSFWLVQQGEPLMWMIDTAPIFLGWFASLAGQRQDQLRSFADSLEDSIARRTQELVSTNSNLQSEIIDRKKAESQSREANQELRAIFDTIPGAITVIDREMTVVDLSDQMVRLKKLPNREMAIGKKCHEVFAVKDEPCSFCTAHEVLETGIPTSRLTTPEEEDELGGTYMIYINPIIDDRENIWGAVEVFIDVTSLKQTEKALQEANAQLNIWLQDLEHHNRRAYLLNSMGELFQTCLSVEEAYAVVGHYGSKFFPGQSGGLYIYSSKNRSFLDKVTEWGENQPLGGVISPNDCWALRRGRIHVMADPSTDLCCPHLEDTSCSDREVPMCVPLVAQGETLGLLHVSIEPNADEDRGTQVKRWEELVSSVADRVAPALTSLRLSNILRTQSIRDALTGLFNRRYLEETLERELNRANRHKRPMSILLFDIDHFKKFNDTHGHGAGDEVLREISKYIQASTRAEDIACRYGGEEFVLIMTEATRENAYQRAEGLRAGIKSLKVNYRETALDQVTISIGVAANIKYSAAAEELLRAADLALYRAKEAGRDRVNIADDHWLPDNDSKPQREIAGK
jgi:diguanylate cyclase (GGDEF)-like protein